MCRLRTDPSVFLVVTTPHKPNCRVCALLPHTWWCQPGLDCPVRPQARERAQDCMSHSSPHRSSLSSAGFSPSNSCRVGFAEWHKVIINQVRRYVLCFLLHRRGPYGLITSSVRQIYVYKISEVMCNCQDPVVWFETSMQWTLKCCRCAMKYKCKMEEVRLSS